MKSILNYFYNINVIDIDKYKDYFIVKTDEDEFLLSEIYDFDLLKKIIDYLNGSNVLYHLLIYNKENDIVFNYEDKNYALFKVRFDKDYQENIFSFSNLILTGKCNWGEVWSNRVDYYYQQVDEIIILNEVKYIMNYYIGLAEIAITYYNNLANIYNINDLKYVISHMVINSPIDLYYFLNPTNMCIDLCIRDVAEYIKYSFYNDILTNEEIIMIISKLELNDALANYFLVRLIYPSYIFRLFDNYIETGVVDNKLYSYVKKSREFESLLGNIYLFLKNKFDIKAFIYFFKFQR